MTFSLWPFVSASTAVIIGRAFSRHVAIWFNSGASSSPKPTRFLQKAASETEVTKATDSVLPNYHFVGQVLFQVRHNGFDRVIVVSIAVGFEQRCCRRFLVIRIAL